MILQSSKTSEVGITVLVLQMRESRLRQGNSSKKVQIENGSSGLSGDKAHAFFNLLKDHLLY